MTGKTLYELYLEIFGGPFTPKWDALSDISREGWGRVADKVLPDIPISVPPDTSYPLKAGTLLDVTLYPLPRSSVDTPDVPLAAGDDCPKCHTPQLPKWKTTDKTGNARACQACGYVEERVP